jgi:hypothetical protein
MKLKMGTHHTCPNPTQKKSCKEEEKENNRKYLRGSSVLSPT